MQRQLSVKLWVRNIEKPLNTCVEKLTNNSQLKLISPVQVRLVDVDPQIVQGVAPEPRGHREPVVVGPRFERGEGDGGAGSPAEVEEAVRPLPLRSRLQNAEKLDCVARLKSCLL